MLRVIVKAGLWTLDSMYSWTGLYGLDSGLRFGLRLGLGFGLRFGLMQA